MADEIVFYTNPQSRGAMTHWMLEEIGCPYRLEVKAYGPEMKSPDYLAINPMGKVPAIKHGETVVTETGAILCYLADAFPAAKLAPPVGARGAYYRWLFFVAGCCEPAPRQQGGRLEPHARAAGPLRLRLVRAHHRHRRQGGRGQALHCGRAFHRGRPLHGVLPALGHDVRRHREAAGLRDLRQAAPRAPGGPAGAGAGASVGGKSKLDWDL